MAPKIPQTCFHTGFPANSFLGSTPPTTLAQSPLRPRLFAPGWTPPSLRPGGSRVRSATASDALKPDRFRALALGETPGGPDPARPAPGRPALFPLRNSRGHDADEWGHAGRGPPGGPAPQPNWGLGAGTPGLKEGVPAGLDTCILPWLGGGGARE